MGNLHDRVKERWPHAVLELHDDRGDETVVLMRDDFTVIMKALKEDPEFDFQMLMDLTAVDGKDLGWKPRFEVVYHLYSLSKNHRLRVKVRVNERDALMPTATTLWAIADWFEREVWDMFGIRFEGHPDLRRILMYDEFVGHPLRKDYPHNKRQPLIGPKN
ncbi:MAG: NADH-quinone oxidoreductase subunit C [Candidatus Omnitrophota bacterium]|nr:NADH-quinone oxidoreductase subunit C [Candidatus Omnitrophota bacterium]